jgi:hypothetical protein
VAVAVAFQYGTWQFVTRSKWVDSMNPAGLPTRASREDGDGDDK